MRILGLPRNIELSARAPRALRAAARRSSDEGGFTLVELVIVMLLVTILGGVVLLRAQPAESSTPAQADRLARDVRHMQMLALQWGVPLRLTSTATGYSVACVSGSGTAPCNGASPVVDPADIGRPGGYRVTLENGVTLNATSVSVDSLGRPCTAPCTAVANIQTASTTFMLTGGSRTASVTVRPLTGSIVMAY